MNKPVFRLKYSLAGAVYETVGYSGPHFSVITVNDESGVKLTLIPSRPITLISASLEFWHEYEKNEKFFVNGYQSWTTSGEVSSEDIYRGTTPLAGVTKYTKDMAITSGDYAFTRYEPRPGFFHSFTYTYLRRGDEFELFGSLSERNGYTVFYSDMEKHIFSVEKDVEGLTISEPYEMFDIVRFVGGYDEVFDKYFAAMSLPAKKRVDRLTGYTSWYNYFQKIDENIILRDLKGLSRARESVNIFQIDDGYEPFVGDWLDYNGRDFPNGMKTIADAVHREGYLVGIWLAPFNVQRGKSRILKEHPDWLIRNPDGKPQLGCVAWGGAYTLDIYNPEVREHLKKVFDTVLNDWGYDMVKLDFLYSQCRTPRDNKTRGTIMCEAMDFLRECVGDKLILGCGVPLGPTFGVVDACRISCDVDLSYGGKFYNSMSINNELPSAQNAINNSMFRRHLNGRAFLNDPDVFFLRDHNLTFTWEQKLLLAKINNLFGRVLFVSDDAGEYSEAELEVLKETFRESDAKILDVKCVGARADGNYEIKFIENGEEKLLYFNLFTGASNILEVR
ncbi:MAG TPA: alpha-galactosidase [Ruminococcaceae bacterium]|nr:alpha-galactosidase [Oscillospiraceae bacterium]HBW73110.1 alpha-galactosidase [Oscillospiraceae bacterium]